MIKVLTLNLNYYGDRHGPWEIRRELICGAIQRAQPDLIALQAVRRDPAVQGGQDQAAQLAGVFPQYRWIYFRPAAELPDGGGEGSALLSRFPWSRVDDRALTLLPGLDDTNPRVLLAATFVFEEGPLNLFNGHFSWVSEQAQDNLAKALNFMQGFAGPSLLVGDLNTPPESDLWKPLAAAGWVDAWKALRPDEDGYTFVEGGRLSKRIDYAWANAALHPHVLDIQVVADEQQPGGVRASDHAGLLVELDLHGT